jgi:outer membrane translocation and assembly module TamA
MGLKQFMITRSLALFFGVIWSIGASSQEVTLRVKTTDEESASFVQQTEMDTLYSNIPEALRALKELQERAYALGFPAASMDSLKTDSSVVEVSFSRNASLRIHQLTNGNLPEAWLAETGFRPGEWSGRPVGPRFVEKLSKNILDYAENNGFPFAMFRMDSLSLSEQGLSGVLFLDKGPMFVFDTIGLRGSAKMNKSFLASYLNIKQGEPYSERNVQEIGQKLGKLNFVVSKAAPRVYFLNDKVRIELFLDERKSDRIDGIVGFAPNSGENSNELLVTGEAEVDLNNLFRRNIGFDLHWQSFLENSQLLQTALDIPYVFNTPLGLTGSFEFLKADTTFFTIDSRLGVRYLFQGSDYLEAYYQLESASLGAVDTASIRARKQLPDKNPVRVSSYGLRLVREQLDYPLNPRKGYRIQIGGSLGNRVVQQNPQIAAIEFQNDQGDVYNLYDSMEPTSLQGQFDGRLELYLPVGKRSAVVSIFEGQYLLANTYFINDLYRFGGTNSLKGFNEESLLASGYGILSLEYRYLLGQNTFFQAFGNLAYIEDKTQEEYKDLPYGFGLGLTLETNSGMLNLAYALGSQQRNPIQFSQAKIHFGVVSFF